MGEIRFGREVEKEREEKKKERGEGKSEEENKDYTSILEDFRERASV